MGSIINFSQQINSLPEMPYSAVSAVNSLYSTYVTIGEPRKESTLNSKSLSLSAIQQNTTDIIRSLPYFYPTEKWTFNKGINIPDKTFNAAVKAGLSSTLIPKKLLENDFMQLLRQLSSDLYVNNHIPSAKGEIIYSTTLKSESAVKKIYGEYTSWKQIPGRFVLAKSNSGAFANVNVKGGEPTHTITINELPKHKHEFVPADNEKILVVETETEPDMSQFSGKMIVGPESGRGVAAASTRSQTFSVSPETHSLEVKFELTEAGTIYGSEGASIEIKENSSGSKPHSNMPPFYTVYIWERTK